MPPRTMFDKIWDDHVVADLGDGFSLLHVDRHLLHDGAGPGLARVAARGLPIARPDLTFATMDHVISTAPGRPATSESRTRALAALRAGTGAAGIPLFDTDSGQQGIVHVIGPELGLTFPGALVVCADSHTCTHGALGALGFGIGASEAEHVLATQTIGEVLGFAGLLGAGRTELLRAIAGLVPVQAGTVTMNGRDVTAHPYARRVREGLGFTPESRKEDGILPLLGVDENIVAADFSNVSRFGVISAPRMAAAARGIIERIGIKTARPGTPIGTLSGGNQQKAVIGRWIYADATILLLDEPTRGVDVEAKLQIYGIIQELAASGRSVIFVSSEIEELPNVCDRVLVLKEGRFVAEFVAPDIRAERLMAACL